MAFSLASWNVLAPSYVNPDWYPGTHPSLLEPATRLPAVVRHVLALDADVICLQEVEAAQDALLRAALEPLGYRWHHARKGARKPDGCSTFVRSTLGPQSSRALHYADGRDGAEDSGHVALLVSLEHDGRPITIANTHVKWDPPGTEPEAQLGLRQIAQLLRERRAGAFIICGDLNVVPASDVVRALHAAGLRDACGDPACTAVANGRAKKIDYIFHDASLVARPARLPSIHDRTPLPSPEQPSDHLAISASFDWS